MVLDCICLRSVARFLYKAVLILNINKMSTLQGTIPAGPIGIKLASKFMRLLKHSRELKAQLSCDSSCQKHRRKYGLKTGTVVGVDQRIQTNITN